MTASALSVVAYGAFLWLCLVIAVVVLLVLAVLLYKAYRRNHVTPLDRINLQIVAKDLAAERGES